MTNQTDKIQIKEKTSTPLYKRLNEERTGGEWLSSPESDPITVPCSYFNGKEEKNGFKPILYKSANCGISKKEENANAQYTVLAVNNLHKIADALEQLHLLVMKSDDRFIFDNGANFEIVAKAKEALNSIS